MNDPTPDPTPDAREFEEDHCEDCGELFVPLALPRPHMRCPECAAKRAEQGEAL